MAEKKQDQCKSVLQVKGLMKLFSKLEDQPTISAQVRDPIGYSLKKKSYCLFHLVTVNFALYTKFSPFYPTFLVPSLTLKKLIKLSVVIFFLNQP